MYGDSVYQWNVYKGCKYDCLYCLPSFQKQAKRQKHRCMKCYRYEPHIHWERLKKGYRKRYFPKETKGDEFIWACSSGDITFAEPIWIKTILKVIEKEHKDLTFFMQTKNPECFKRYSLPKNLIIGITLETNKDTSKVSAAPSPKKRVKDFIEIEHKQKTVTVEPILEFDMNYLREMIVSIDPERVYVGYNSKPKMCEKYENSQYLKEPSLQKTTYLIEDLENMGIKVKKKVLREAHFYR